MDNLDYSSGGGNTEDSSTRDPAILEKLLANPSAQADILAGSNDKYDWTQNGREVEEYVHLEPDVTRKEVKCTIEKDSLSIEVRGNRKLWLVSVCVLCCAVLSGLIITCVMYMWFTLACLVLS